MKYQNFYKNSIENPEQFWSQQANQLEWFKSPKQIKSKDKYDYNHLAMFIILCITLTPLVDEGRGWFQICGFYPRRK